MSRILVPEKPGGNIPGLQRAPGILVTCRHCGHHVPPDEFKDSLCWDCWCTRECAGHRAELVRLYRKRVHYQKKAPRASLKGNDEQAERVRIRILKVVTQLTPRMDVVERIVNNQGRLAREAALTTSSRIHLPGVGGFRR